MKNKHFKSNFKSDLKGSILLIVESPGKIKKIKSCLPNDYIVMASIGHIIDLPPKRLGIDIDTLQPEYEIYPDKKKIINGLKTIISNNPNIEIYIASDGDREGEFIGYSLVQTLNIKSYKRIIFHEITKSAIIKAIDEKKDNLDNNLICAQMCRRMIDRLIGYPISNELSKNVKGAYSAGRVQSVIVKLIYDKCNERDIFLTINKDATYYTCNGYFIIDNNMMKTDLYHENNHIKTDKKHIMILLNTYKKILPNPYIKNISEKELYIYAPQPFITSTLQQDAYYKYKFSSEMTMILAQHLYEKGHITYMRTDSPNISNEVMGYIKNYIIENYGEKYYKYKQYKAKGNAQEAHEAIRPTHIETFELEIEKIGENEQKLYDLIWKRTIASQMIPSIVKNKEIIIRYANDIIYDKYKTDLFDFIGTISYVVEPGFKIVYDIEHNDEDLDEENQNHYTNINKQSKVNIKEIIAKEQIKTIPTLYNQPMIIKRLEKYGIGRPSTYATLLKNILKHKYVEISHVKGIEKELEEIKLNKKLITSKIKRQTIGSEKQKYIITEIGKLSTEYLNKKYPLLMNYNFTSDMEKKLDLVAEGQLNYINVVRECNNSMRKN